MRRFAPLALLACLGALLALPAAADEGQLRAGVGRSDLTSPTGYYMQGWVRSDAVLEGVHTRLEARAIVLQQGGKKVALVAVGLNGVAGGVVADAAELLADRGFSEANIVVSGSHTHGSPSGYYNYNTYNTVFPTTTTLTDQNVQGELDPQLYAFEVRRLAEAIARADDDLAPAKAGWGRATLPGVTANRSLEAHLRNHGVVKAFGEGRPEDDPMGAAHTVTDEVQVLRVDKVVDGRDVPVGMWSSFANHGTTNKATFGVYNDDHHGSATRVVEDEVRRLGRVPAGQDVVNAYGNGAEGDQSAGLVKSGPAWADEVGRLEAAGFLAAWQSAGSALSVDAAIDVRWTRVDFAGRATAEGPTSASAVAGLPLFTGSEEGRGPLFDITQVPFEGRALPADDPLDPAQGRKVQLTRQGGGPPPAASLLVVRVGDRLVATVPGEMTAQMGRRVRASVGAAASGTGVTDVVISGLANEYVSYFATPEEYDAQHYEGGSQMYGRTSSVLVQEQLTALAAQLSAGEPATAPSTVDPRNGVTADDAPPFGTGATSATALEQPGTTQRLARAAFAWQGGLRGLDMPAGRAFLTVERRDGGAWQRVTDDLGLQLLWTVDDEGRYDAQWEAPRDAVLGEHRFVVTANSYRLESAGFTLEPSTRLSVDEEPGTGRSRARYPDAVTDVDLTFRPVEAATDDLTPPDDVLFRFPVAAGGVRDEFGNCNGAEVTGEPGTRTGADADADPAVCGPQPRPRPAPQLPESPPAGRPPGAVPVRGGAPFVDGGLAATGGVPWLPVAGALLLLSGVVAGLRGRRA